ncbi:hydrogen gas-evolving membrane-bound hydrogenase subunit E [candidate division KSB1 bacterium]
MLIFYLLLLMMILGSIVAIETRNLLSSVISVGIVGFTLSILFLMLGAPDLAITQIVVEILTLIILIRATISAEHVIVEKSVGTFSTISSLIFFGLFLVFASFAFVDLHPFSEPLMRTSQHYLENGLSETGAGNTVTAIILDYRAYDTLGEMTVLFLSALGAGVIMRKVGRKRNSSVPTEKK